MTKDDLATVLVIEADLFPIDAWTKELFLGELAEVSISRDVSVAVLDSQIVGYASFRYVGKQGDVNTVAIIVLKLPEFFSKKIRSFLLDFFITFFRYVNRIRIRVRDFTRFDDI
jgi:ribosomal-protein-alanine N-acetyltransferase